MTTYYSIHDGLVLLARTMPGDNYRYLNKSGKWKDGNGRFEQYFYNGEPGAEVISRTEAEQLANTFGSTLESL